MKLLFLLALIVSLSVLDIYTFIAEIRLDHSYVYKTYF